MAKLTLHAPHRHEVRVKVEDIFITRLCPSLSEFMDATKQLRNELDRLDKEATKKFKDEKWLKDSLIAPHLKVIK